MKKDHENSHCLVWVNDGGGRRRAGEGKGGKGKERRGWRERKKCVEEGKVKCCCSLAKNRKRKEGRRGEDR